MKIYEKYLNEGKLSYGQIKRDISKGIDSDNSIDLIVSGLERYLNSRQGMIYIKQNKKNLADELWDRLASYTEKSEYWNDDILKKLKGNFYNFVNKQAKNFDLESTEDKKYYYFIHKDTPRNSEKLGR